MIVGVQYFNNDVIFTIFKKHYCSKCGAKLDLIKRVKIVNSESPESKNFNFCIGDGFVKGDVKFIWKEFQCPNCRTEYTINELRRIEKQKKIEKKAKK